MARSTSHLIKLHELSEQANRVKNLHRLFKPHAGQIEAGKNLFTYNKKFIFAQCGRSWGKSLFAAYCAVRVALTHRYARVYIVLPERTQAMEVFWASGYLRDMIPKQYLIGDGSEDEAFNKSELRVSFSNYSFIKLLGADNPDSLRGPKPHFVVFDEFRDFKSAAFDIMEPNLSANDATLLICSTPPNTEGSYTALRTFFMDEMHQGNKTFHYMELPTETNPHFPPNRLAATKQMLEKRGEVGVWLREYMAQFIPGGANSVFPKFVTNKRHIMRDPEFLDTLLTPDKRKLDWYVLFDPAQNSTFAVLFAAINRRSGQIYLLDEIYEQDRANTGSLDMWKRAHEIKMRLYPYEERWRHIYDEQASWFYNDLDRYGVLGEGVSLEPTQKRTRDKSNDMSIIKDLFATRGRIFISRACKMTVWEVENYATSEDGDFIKKRDHEIDNLRYLIAASEYEPNELTEDALTDEASFDDQPQKRRPPTFAELFKKNRVEDGFSTGDMDSYEDIEVTYLDDLMDGDYN